MDIFLIKALNYKQGNTTFALRFESKANEEVEKRLIEGHESGLKKTSKKLLQKLGIRKADVVHLHPL